MILDGDAEVRSAGYRLAPPGLGDVREVLDRALTGTGPVALDALTFLEHHPDPVAREVLVAAMVGRPGWARTETRFAVASIDSRRHGRDPEVVVPDLERWEEQPAPPLWAERAYGAVDRTIARTRRSITVSRRRAAEQGRTFDDGPDGWYAQAQRTIAVLSRVTLQDCDESAMALGGKGCVHPALRSLSHQEERALTEGLTVLQRLRLLAEPTRRSAFVPGVDYSGVDLRLLVDAAERLGMQRPESAVIRDFFHPSPGYLDRALAWPLLMEQPGILDHALGLAVPEDPADDRVLVKALRVLRDMPRLPRRYLPRVAELALTGKARPRRAARLVLEVHGRPVVVAVQGLSHGRAPVRAAAGSWLAELGEPASLPELERALAREQAPSARAALSEAASRLHQLSPPRTSSRPLRR
jgi:hypothetical protein